MLVHWSSFLPEDPGQARDQVVGVGLVLTVFNAKEKIRETNSRTDTHVPHPESDTHVLHPRKQAMLHGK